MDVIWEKCEHGILSITTILMSVLLVSNAVSRYFFNKSWAFTEEIGKMGILVLTFIGISYAARKGMHIEMSGFYDMMSKKLQLIVSVLIHFVSAIVLLLCTYLAMQYVVHLYDLQQVSTILRIPLYITMLVVPIGFGIAAIRYFVDFIVAVKKLR